MSERGWREFLAAEGTLAAGGRIVDDTDAPAGWILADRAGNRVCVAASPDGAGPPT
jgi:4a-hydroxytetrahydrobiopterin dehydratase